MKPLILLSILLVLIFASSVSAQIDLQGPLDEQVSSTAFIQFVFSKNYEATSCSLILDGQTNKTISHVPAGESTISIDVADGIHTWAIKCSTNSGDEISQARTLIVDTKAPVVQLLLPEDQSRVGNNEFVIKYIPKDSNLKSCSLYSNLNNQFEALLTDHFPESNNHNIFNAIFPDGTYLWNILCTDTANNAMTSTISRSITIDTKPPKITSTSPGNTINAKSTTLFATTDEKSTCKYSKTQNVSYQDKSFFDITGQLSHSVYLSDLQDGIFDYFISCRDDLGNEMQNYRVQLDVHLLPTAVVELDKSSPIKAGILTVNLKTTKKMTTPPRLTYILEGETEKEVALTGENDAWEGRILIGESTGKKLGVFYFRGTDTKGFVGTVITEGKTFIVDTDKPKQVQNLEAQTILGKPIINWYSEDDDIKTFNIYRKNAAGVAYTNLYASTNDSTFTDSLTSDKATYYYKIAAMDNAGNVGPLSSEIYVTSLSGKSKPQTVDEPEEVSIQQLPPNLVYLVNDQVSVIESRKQTVEVAKEELEKLTGEELVIAQELGLIQEAADAINSLNILKNEAEKLKERYISESELNSKLENLDIDAKKFEKSVIKSINIDQKTEFESIIEETDLSIGAQVLLESFGVSENQKEKYLKLTKKDLENFKIVNHVSKVTLEYVNGQTEKNTIVTRGISYQDTEQLNDVVLLEIIPSLVADDVDQIKVVQGTPEFVNSEPVIKWGFLTMGYEDQVVKYIIRKDVAISDVKQIQAIPFTRLSDIATIPSQATGFSIFPDIEASSIWPLVAILALVSVLLAYYFSPSIPILEKNKSSILSQENIHRINRKFATMPIGIDEKIYPTVIKINEAMIQKNNLKGVQIAHELVDSGLYYAMLGDLNKARATYDSIRLIYGSLTHKEKSLIGSRCVELRSKLSNEK